MKKKTIKGLEIENIELKKVLNELIDMYIKNRGVPGSEFIACITPNHASELNPLQRLTNKYWNLWDRARILTGEIK